MKTLLMLMMLTVAAVKADSGINFTDWQGTASVASSGISGNASLICYSGIKAYNGHTLGNVMFKTGQLMSGTVAGGGIYSSAGSLFTITGNGRQRMHDGVVFSGAFTGPIQWILMSQSGSTSNYALAGRITGQLWSGRTTTGYTTQLITITGGQAFLMSGRNSFGDGKLTTPEPNTLILIGTGVSLVSLWRKRIVQR